jgi:signal transduction histidine kinase
MTSGPPVKFLLVDDLEANLIALEGLLRRDGLELLKARSGSEALELLLRHDVALALLDVQMAGMDGFELAELMRGTERTRRVPIIFLTAGAVDQTRRFRGYEAGAVDFIFKPIESHILQSKAGVFFELALQREALRQSAAEAQAANRAKDDFLAALSHELRTPLTPVLMLAAELENDASLGADAREQIALIRCNIELEARLIDDLLDISRIRTGKLTLNPVVTDVHDLLQRAVDIAASEVPGKQVKIVSSLAAERHRTLVDPIRLQQVFWNLLKNALKFTPPGGEVFVETKNDAQGRIVVTVRDTGVGISATALPKLFRAFEQGDVAGQHRYGGLGLGLSISRAIVEAHGGSVMAASDGIGCGATFTVALTATSHPAAPPDRPEHPPVCRALRLLLVDDHEATRSVLSRLLTKDGHTLCPASSKQEALATFSSQQFDAVISDLGLPDGSGLELMRELRQIRPVAGIAISGYGTEDDVRHSKAAGFVAHLTKPVKLEQVRELLAQISAESAG